MEGELDMNYRPRASSEAIGVFTVYERDGGKCVFRLAQHECSNGVEFTVEVQVKDELKDPRWDTGIKLTDLWALQLCRVIRQLVCDKRDER